MTKKADERSGSKRRTEQKILLPKRPAASDPERAAVKGQTVLLPTAHETVCLHYGEEKQSREFTRSKQRK